MSILDWLIVIPIGLYILWLLMRPKKKGCCGNCSGCSGCSCCKM